MKFEIKQIKELLALMKRGGIRRLHWKTSNGEIELELEDSTKKKEHTVSQVSPTNHTHPPMAPSPIHPKEPSDHQEEKQGHYITSPLVGTFYRKSSPSHPEFIKLNQSVDRDMIVCIVEAMKVMNEVKAEIKGKIVETLVEDGDTVEFGTKLFRVE